MKEILSFKAVTTFKVIWCKWGEDQKKIELVHWVTLILNCVLINDKKDLTKRWRKSEIIIWNPAKILSTINFNWWADIHKVFNSDKKSPMSKYSLILDKTVSCIVCHFCIPLADYLELWSASTLYFRTRLFVSRPKDGDLLALFIWKFIRI